MTPWRARRRACTPRPCDPPPSASPRLRSAGRLARRRARDDDPARVRLLRAPIPPVLQDEASLAAADAACDAQDAAELAASVAQRRSGLADDGRREGDFRALLTMLAPDVVLRPDRAAVLAGARPDIRGASAGGRSVRRARPRSGPARADRRPGRRRVGAERY